MRKALIALVTCAPIFAQISAVGPTAAITIHVVDKDGYAVEGCRIDRFERRYDLDIRKHDLDMTSHFNGLHGVQVPFGTYDYVVKKRLSATRDGMGSGTASVYRLDVLVVIQAGTELQQGISADGFRTPDLTGIRGRLEPMPRQTSDIDPIWIRLSPVHGVEQLDVNVSPSGEFRIYSAPYGRYLLTVIQGSDVLHVQPIVFGRGFPPEGFVVKLPSTPPELISPQKEQK